MKWIDVHRWAERCNICSMCIRRSWVLVTSARVWMSVELGKTCLAFERMNLEALIND